MHVSSNSYGMYLYEARQRWFSYPPPYWYNGSWYWATPWLWYDGDPHGSYTSSQWESKITTRMAIRAPVTVNMWGDYNASSMTGTIYAQFRNDSTVTLNGHVLFVITEDSIYRAVPNGDVWHNYVARDYLPDYTGTLVSIPAGDSVTVSEAFIIDSEWNRYNLTFVTWFQDTIYQPDTVKEIWQGGMIDFSVFGIEEVPGEDISLQKVLAAPNPCVSGTNFSFNLSTGVEYTISIFDVTGRRVKTLAGLSSGNQEMVVWNLEDDAGIIVSSGVYLYRFESDIINITGKIVVR